MSAKVVLRECAEALKATRPFLLDGRSQDDAYLVLKQVEHALDHADPEWRNQHEAVFPQA